MLYLFSTNSFGKIKPRLEKLINLPYLIYSDYRNAQSQSVLPSDILKPSFPQTFSLETTVILHPRKGSSFRRQQQHFSPWNRRTSFNFSIPPPHMPSSLLLSVCPSPHHPFFFLSQPYITVALSISCLVKLPRRANTRQRDATNLWYLKQRA